jgi:hypothetical protein
MSKIDTLALIIAAQVLGVNLALTAIAVAVLLWFAAPPWFGEGNKVKKMDARKKYEITDARHPHNPRLRRIRAVRPGPWGPAGTIGGWLESERNLAQDGECWVADEAVVWGAARVTDAAWVFDSAWVWDEARIFEDAVVCESARVGGLGLGVGGSARVGGSAVIDRRMCLMMGEHIETPHYRDGSCDSLTHQGGGVVAIGCEVHHLANWLEGYREICKDHGYIQTEIDEYGGLLRHMARMIEEAGELLFDIAHIIEEEEER